MKTILRTKLTFRNLLLICILSTASTTLNAQYYYSNLMVQDPKTWWGYEQGTIESAKFNVEPKGIYANVEMELSLSAKNSYFSEYDTLEAQFSFELPSGSIVNDSWLLINEKWEQAKILDRWTASSIYEGIVQRRRDPSILTKEGKNFFKLNVYPLPAKSTRTVRISFLTPINLSNSNAFLRLPFSILNLSASQVKDITVNVKESMGYSTPRFENFPGYQFSTTADHVQTAIVTNPNIDGLLYFNSPLKNGIYAAKYQNENEGIYQLAFIPSQLLDIKLNKKILYLVNYDANNNIGSTAIINGLKSMLKSTLSNKDSFNIYFSGLNIKKLNNEWLSADTTTIDEAFKNIDKTYFSGYSDLVSLLAEGVEASETENNSAILLISNSDEFNSLSKSNSLIEDLKALKTDLPVISVFDYSIGCNNGFYTNNNYFCGNTYLYGVLSRSTGGSTIKLENNDNFYSKLNEIGLNLGGFIPTFDQITSLENGFCYGRMAVNNSDKQVYANKPILTVGKFNGSFPLQVQISGLYNNKVFSNNIEINENNVFSADTFSNGIWAGLYIDELEASSYLKNDEISNIINYSIENRILSTYTAFLTLEPGIEIEPCEDCENTDNPDVITKVNNVQTKESKIEVLPNPFSQQVKIIVTLNKQSEKELEVRILNTMGQLVKIIRSKSAGNGIFEIIWDGKNQSGATVANGTYIVSITSGTFSKTVKVVKK